MINTREICKLLEGTFWRIKTYTNDELHEMFKDIGK